ncbi:MAG: hypothetical protein Kow0068_05920 [Marinilabiliales bacterium]
MGYNFEYSEQDSALFYYQKCVDFIDDKLKTLKDSEQKINMTLEKAKTLSFMWLVYNRKHTEKALYYFKKQNPFI